MRKNFTTNIQAKFIVGTLLAKGYTRPEIARMADLNIKTIYNVMEKKYVTLNTDKKLEMMFEELGKITEKEQTKDSYFLTIEDVIDEEDVKEGVREITIWLTITLSALVLGIIGMVAVIRYIIGLLG